MQHRNALQLSRVDEPTEKIPADDEGREQRSQNTKRKRDREAFNRAARPPK